MRRIARVAAAGLVVTVVGSTALIVAYLRVEVPEPRRSATIQASIVTYADDRTELGRFRVTDRRSVRLSEVPADLRHAVLAAEDRDFHNHRGVSVRGIVRATWSNLRGGDTQGGSTITQQYVKNAYLTPERTMARKLREAPIALKLEQRMSKDEILEGYLNTVYFGRGASGVEAAAKAYFATGVGDLDTAQAAFLAALIQLPTILDATTDPAPPERRRRLERRWRHVLEGMVGAGWLDAADAASLRFPEPVERATSQGPDVHLMQAVAAELEALGLSGQDLYTGGLRVRTTVDPALQAAATRAVDRQLWRRLGKRAGRSDVRAGLVALRPGDGAVLAMYGGRDYGRRQLNDATQSVLPVGPMVQPFVAAARSEHWMLGVAGRSRIAGVVDKASPSPTNVPMRAAPTRFTDADIRATLRDVGFSDGTIGLDSPARLHSGDLAAKVIDVAAAYGTLAADGRNAKPYLVAEVRTQEGTLLYQAAPAARQVLRPEVALLAGATTSATVVPAAVPGDGELSKVRRLVEKITGGGGPVETTTLSGVALAESAAWSVTSNRDLVTVAAVFRDAPDLGPAPADRSLSDVRGLPDDGNERIPMAITAALAG